MTFAFFHFFLLFNDKLDMKDFNKTAVFRCNFSIWHLLSYVIHFNEPLNDSREFEIIKTNVVFGAHFFRLGGEHSEHLTGSFISLFHGLIKTTFFLSSKAAQPLSVGASRHCRIGVS